MNILKVPSRILGNRRDRRVALGAVLGLFAAGGLIAFAVVMLGAIDIAASSPHGVLTTELLHFVFNRTVSARANAYDPPPDLNDPTRLRVAAQHFDAVCSNCHGAPGIGQSPVALSMMPRPQSLPAVVGQFDDSELFWIVKHGVKFSAMPAWPTRARDDEVWSMVAFLRQLPGMSALTYLHLARAGESDHVPAIPIGDDIRAQPADTRRNTFPKDEFLYARPAIGFMDSRLQSTPVVTCMRCHGGTDGDAPRLDLQDAGSLATALRGFATGRRLSGFMQPVAAALSDDQIEALAAYFAAKQGKETASGEPAAETPDAAALERGQRIATAGIAARGEPACATCHDRSGGGLFGAPHLAGQTAAYLKRQLRVMRDFDRGASGTGWNPMPAIAGRLADEDIDALAAYYSAQPAGQPLIPERAPTVGAEALAAAGRTFETVCSTCHGRDGAGDKGGDVPNLTIQSRDFARHALQEFRAGLRDSEKMRLAAQGLSDERIDALSAFVAGLEPHPSKPAGDVPVFAVDLAEHGDAGRGLAACTSCHVDLAGRVPLIPRLSGQTAGYLKRKLDWFASPAGRTISALNPMPAIAVQLSDEERAGLAAYFSSRPPQKADDGSMAAR